MNLCPLSPVFMICVHVLIISSCKVPFLDSCLQFLTWRSIAMLSLDLVGSQQRDCFLQSVWSAGLKKHLPGILSVFRGFFCVVSLVFWIVSGLLCDSWPKPVFPGDRKKAEDRELRSLDTKYIGWMRRDWKWLQV